MRLDFDNLPLVEAAARVSFVPPIPLTFSMINAVHDTIKDEFPRLATPSRFEAAPGIGTRTVTISPDQLVGVVYTGNARGLSIGLQQDVIIARWQRSISEPGVAYPRFPGLRKILLQTIDAVRAAATPEALTAVVVNMSYTNFIEAPVTADALRDYFSRTVHVEALADADTVNKLELAWREGDTDLRFCLENVTAKLGDTTSDGFRLTTVAGQVLERANADTPHGLNAVHQRLQLLFTELISEQAKLQWGLKVARDDE